MTDNPPLEKHEITISYTDNPDIDTKLATNVIIQHTPDNEFIISFFELLPFIAIGDEAQQKALADIDSINAKLVSRIVISATRMPGFIRALSENYTKYQDRQAEYQKIHEEQDK